MTDTGAGGSGEQTFERYFSEYYQQVFRYLLKKVSSPQTAEDLAMDAFAACWRRFGGFDAQKASFATWLYVAVNNRLKNYYRDRKLWEELEETSGVLEDFEDSLVAAACLDGMREALAGALESLPPLQREIVVQRYFFEKNASEIAPLTGLTPGNVRVQLSRALKKMRDYFQTHNIRWEN